jgi:hypothetical protein
MTPADFEKLMDVAIAKATKAREVGIRRISLGDVALELEPQEPKADLNLGGDDKNDDDKDALNDPATFGRTKKVPGRQPAEAEDD